MNHSQISDKFFYGMSFDEKMKNLVELNISRAFLVTDSGFIHLIKS